MPACTIGTSCKEVNAVASPRDRRHIASDDAAETLVASLAWVPGCRGTVLPLVVDGAVGALDEDICASCGPGNNRLAAYFNGIALVFCALRQLSYTLTVVNATQSAPGSCRSRFGTRLDSHGNAQLWRNCKERENGEERKFDHFEELEGICLV